MVPLYIPVHLDGTKSREELFDIVYHHIQNNLEELTQMEVCILLKRLGANHVQIIICKEILATFLFFLAPIPDKDGIVLDIVQKVVVPNSGTEFGKDRGR